MTPKPLFEVLKQFVIPLIGDWAQSSMLELTGQIIGRLLVLHRINRGVKMCLQKLDPDDTTTYSD